MTDTGPSEWGETVYSQRVIGQSAFVDFRLGGSAFNIKAESLWLGDFTEIEARVRALLAGHTAERGRSARRVSSRGLGN